MSPAALRTSFDSGKRDDGFVPIGIIFDCDGVLLDSMQVWQDAETQLSVRAGVRLTEDDRRTLATFTIDEVGDFYHSRFGLGKDSADVVSMVDEIMLDFYSHRSSPIPGIETFLQAMALRDVRMSVVSSSPHPYLLAGLGHAGIAQYFCGILSVDDLNTSKREPLIFEQAMRDMGTDPAGTWGFDDSYYAVQTMSKLGIATVGIFDAQSPFHLEELRASADWITSDYSRLNVDAFAAGPSSGVLPISSKL